ncbi:hypothetical protein H6G54_02735 [Anabaena cylindrica FACHB-243]|uniref:Uncharacterized protein n=1 Tax=Anabaena cylindrica (strain ATCC 27899 / PCC 7122) TaxID=272123 RepID=K9ZRF0_ANACC|nr:MULTISPECIES: hypothetical protein [Anabaena]AFZ61344.1 hypothetical protein Anacy_6069 [Anabaena cylindrica PCC 7122]MBD2416643.1 hypothetical protein [Anabaena cylindrica FACHB-243]MBY5281118.1 hypothetical protein [Anabaena sp. CCAP 1446/1C]MBY5306744.1 hypothetical protein [Anabaena sp. CCAP 1446/1C]MCM2410096.1 hypothetical protein [Anabaena sp. CCAP 1446/1C]
MTTTKIYLELDDDILQFVKSNVDISDILQTENIDAEVRYGIEPYLSEEGARTKDIVTIILASSAALATISFVISQVLNTYYRKPYFVEYYEIHELKDAKGNFVLDKEGNPQYEKIKKYQIIEPKKESTIQNFEFQFSFINGVVIKFSSDVKDID